MRECGDPRVENVKIVLSYGSIARGPIYLKVTVVTTEKTCDLRSSPQLCLQGERSARRLYFLHSCITVQPTVLLYCLLYCCIAMLRSAVPACMLYKLYFETGGRCFPRKRS